MNHVGTYTKAVVTIIAAGIGILAAALSDGEVTSTEYVQIGIAIVTALGVYGVPNLTEGAGRYLKTFVALAGAALAALVAILNNNLEFADVTSADWLNVLLAGLAAVGVYILPNTNNAVTSAAARGRVAR